MWLLQGRFQCLHLLNLVLQLCKQDEGVVCQPRPSREWPLLESHHDQGRKLGAHRHRWRSRVEHQHELNPSRSVELLNSGNLVVKDGQGSVLWQSFGSPTDTLLPTQPITKNSMLVSGYYRFYFDNDNVLKLIYDGPEISSIYWPDPDKDVWNNLRTYYNSTRYGVLDEKGEFIASDRLAFNASDMGIGILRRLTLDNDGNLRLYSLNNSTGLWSVTWAALSNICLIHGLCGKNGICLYTESEACCSCPPNFEMADASDWRKGCKRNFNINCDKPDELTFMELPKTDFWGFDINVSNKVPLDSCKQLCVSDCNCLGIHYNCGTGKCYTKSLLFNGYNIRKLVGTTVPSSSERRSDSGQ
ncbi:receptor protein kinase ZmPK1 isoform X3 [Canna indica]|uniref:Receptor protein kinase ZmPK1 isoform X3 n=1 Tax=Canna indica TaxID=4628 RepID=A0AAQ3KE24_9LILI|nr:receptor protein kinase ZmPK1 isoform X3 [Canna indica]